MAVVKSKHGRPSDYTPELGIEICDVIASNSKGIKRLCEENPHWPNKDTIFTWLKKHTEFSDQYAKAKVCQISVLVDDILDISDDSSGDTMIDEHGRVVYNGERVTRSRLRIDSRKWLACKLVPRIYGIKPDDSTYVSHEESLKLLQDISDVQERYNKEY